MSYFSNVTYDASTTGYNSEYPIYIDGTSASIPVNGAKYYGNVFGNVMCSLINDGGDTILGGNLLVTQNINLGGGLCILPTYSVISGNVSTNIRGNQTYVSGNSLSYLSGVSSNIQAQINNVSANVSGNATYFSGLTSSLQSQINNVSANVSGNTTYFSTITSGLQSQINNVSANVSGNATYFSGLTASLQSQITSLKTSTTSVSSSSSTTVISSNVSVYGNTINHGQIDASNLAISGYSAIAESSAIGGNLCVGNDIINSGSIFTGKQIQCSSLIVNNTVIQSDTQAQIIYILDVLARNHLV